MQNVYKWEKETQSSFFDALMAIKGFLTESRKAQPLVLQRCCTT